LRPRRWKMVLAGIPVVGLTLIGVGAWGMANIDQPEVTTKEATAVAHTRAMLNGSLPGLGGSSSLEVYFEWGKSDSYGSSTDKVTLESAGPFSAEIDTLDPDEEYHFRAIASSGTCDDCGS
jgi:hypothetical protein